jgi:hypothetical protein
MTSRTTGFFQTSRSEAYGVILTGEPSKELNKISEIVGSESAVTRCIAGLHEATDEAILRVSQFNSVSVRR